MLIFNIDVCANLHCSIDWIEWRKAEFWTCIVLQTGSGQHQTVGVKRVRIFDIHVYGNFHRSLNWIEWWEAEQNSKEKRAEYSRQYWFRTRNYSLLSLLSKKAQTSEIQLPNEFYQAQSIRLNHFKLHTNAQSPFSLRELVLEPIGCSTLARLAAVHPSSAQPPPSPSLGPRSSATRSRKGLVCKILPNFKNFSVIIW